MPNFSYKRAPNFGPRYKLVSGGDKYTFFYYDKDNPAMGTIVNYSVATNILNQSSGWSTVSGSSYDTERTNTLNKLSSSPSTIYGKLRYYAITKQTMIAIINDGGDEIFSETVNYNPETLEYNILVNINPTYVSNLFTFLENNADPTESQSYDDLRLAAYNEIFNEGAGGAVEIG